MLDIVRESAAAISTPGATPHGKVMANNANTQYWLACSASSTALTRATTRTGSLTGITATAVSATLTNLKAKTIYYSQLLASNAVGTSSGVVQSFKTNKQARAVRRRASRSPPGLSYRSSCAGAAAALLTLTATGGEVLPAKL